MSRGLNEADATTMVVSGFIEPLGKRIAHGICSGNESIDPTSNGWFRRVRRGKND